MLAEAPMATAVVISQFAMDLPPRSRSYTRAGVGSRALHGGPDSSRAFLVVLQRERIHTCLRLRAACKERSCDSVGTFSASPAGP